MDLLVRLVPLQTKLMIHRSVLFKGKQGGLARCCGLAALRIIHERIDRGIARIGDVLASEVSEG